jgi:hypothetical protein
MDSSTLEEEIKMANINTIRVRIKTGNKGVVSGANGDVYLGIGGREFHLAIFGAKDFRAGETEDFILGDGTNIGVSPNDNDPRSPCQMITETLSSYPLYVRFEPTNEDGRWDLDEIRVTVNPGSDQIEFSALGGESYLWLGNRGTKILHFGA